MGRQGTPRPDATGTSASRRASTYVRAHRARRRWLGVVGVLAAVVACVTALALSLPASTMTKDAWNAEKNQEAAPRVEAEEPNTVLKSDWLKYIDKDVPGSNEWQIVSGEYDPDDVEKIQSNDGNVRVHKSVIPTDTENEFLVYLSIDTKQLFEQYFSVAQYRATTSNAYHNNTPGTVIEETLSGNYDVNVSSSPDSGYVYSATFDIYDDKNSLIAENVTLYWDGRQNVTMFIEIDQTSPVKNILVAVDVSSGTAHNKLVLSKDAMEAIESTLTQLVDLGTVTDTMGSYVNYEGIVDGDYDTETTFDPESNTLRWIPQVKENPTIIDADEAGSSSTIIGEDGLPVTVETSTAWAVNAAELVYKVRLDVEKDRFDSCADNMHSTINDDESYEVNQSATLTYNDGQTVDFQKPHVRGLLYEVAFEKVDAENPNKKLSDAEFTLTDEDGKTHPISEVGDSGTYRSDDLPCGTYTLTETKAPEGYELDENNTWQITLCYTSDHEDVAQDKDHKESNMLYIGSNVASSDVWQITNGRAKTTSLTLTKTFDGLSTAEVDYLIFQQNDGFGWDINYCVSETRKGEDGLTYMADDLPDNIELPDGTKVTGGGDFRITAAQFLSASSLTDAGITDSATGASLKKDTDGNWTYSVTLTVPTTDKDHFYTVFEQHQEVPGYAKINDSNAEWVISTNGAQTTAGSGKFIDTNSNNIYEDSSAEISHGDRTYKGEEYNEEEDVCIAAGAFQQLSITAPTTISFTNHYTGSLDVTKVLASTNDYKEAKVKEFDLVVSPAHPDKLTVTGGLTGKTVTYRADNDGEQTAPLDEKGSFAISLKPGQTARIISLPAIQWKVTEKVNDAELDGYTLNVTYSDENNGVVNDAEHWNKYASDDTIGAGNQTDGIASVDSAVRDVPDKNVVANAVAEVTVTNDYSLNVVDVQVKKVDENGTPLAKATFVVYRSGEDDEPEYYPSTEDASWTNDLSQAKRFESGGVEIPTFTIGGLDPNEGPYYLKEIDAPDGYQRLTHDIQIGWDENGQLAAYYATGDGQTTNSLVDDGVIVVPNSTGVELPSTGGPGTTIATFGGAALVAAAGIGYGLRRNRERRGAQS